MRRAVISSVPASRIASTCGSRTRATGLASVDGLFDMAFIDGVKAQYSDYFDALLPLLRPGAALAVDNVLMSGTVAEGRSDGHWTEEQIAGARAFNERLLGTTGWLARSPRWVTACWWLSAREGATRVTSGAADELRGECSPCRGTGKLISELAARPTKLVARGAGETEGFTPVVTRRRHRLSETRTRTNVSA